MRLGTLSGEHHRSLSENKRVGAVLPVGGGCNIGVPERELRKLRKESTGSFVFVSERGAPFTPASFNWMIKRAGQRAGLPFQVHAQMLRHSAGYKLAGDGHDTRSIQDYLGHKDIRHTVRYTALSPKPFRDFWRD